MDTPLADENPYSPPTSLARSPDELTGYRSTREFLRAVGEQSFTARLNFTRVFLIGLVLTGLFAAPILWFAHQFELLDWKIVGPACLVSIALQAVVIRLQRVVATPDLLHCTDFWGRYHTIRLSSIDSVGKAGWGFFRFLRIENSDSRRPIWLPLFLSRPEVFWHYLELHLPPGSPVREWLDRMAPR